MINSISQCAVDCRIESLSAVQSHTRGQVSSSNYLLHRLTRIRRMPEGGIPRNSPVNVVFIVVAAVPATAMAKGDRLMLLKVVHSKRLTLFAALQQLDAPPLLPNI
ncbi:hypothetical protein KQX54_002064 [Cotesia glomerata]|uniref:Uncharacterized protein n=1 Tax=Cotesia glomerata TaxID=32391 RepID=A0AAV7IZ97_COTGL|nr:hypothetical protein KQX54_002064 [Cotesia glomerata]